MGGGVNPPPLILLVTWISNIGFCVPGNQQINANLVNIHIILSFILISQSPLFAEGRLLN